MHVTAIVAAAGEGRRLGAAVPKQLLDIAGRSILERSVMAFTSHDRVDDVIVVLPPGLTWIEQPVAGAVRIVAGGPRRQDSVANAFDCVSAGSDVVLVHDAARPFVSAALITRAIDAALEHGAAIAAVPARDTVKRVEGAGDHLVISETIPRDAIYLAQTPQAFRRDVLSAAVAMGRTGVEATDEAMLAERAGHRVHVVEGDPANVKITTASDLDAARRASSPAIARIGTGYDLHRLVEGRPLILGGVTVPSDKGATGHSDADVVCHAVIDAVLGAACEGNVGQHYPDTDPRWKGASSIPMLRDSVRLIDRRGLKVANVDVTVILERPKIAPYIDDIRSQLASALEVPIDCVSVKGKTNEGVDAVGRGEAIAAHAVALLIWGASVGRGF
ncbi:MAG TPA: 2-C-methyl-D-erythritol 4-phosphate cytidylyltransferase [Vicinamibacterales bacterium]|nr:2-C-methyl-D-erythritol 4-phosphate cytidylyltransferase [Vicinamibacterales bacterium]